MSENMSGKVLYVPDLEQPLTPVHCADGTVKFIATQYRVWRFDDLGRIDASEKLAPE